MRPFHYAFKVKDIESTRKFYLELLGCPEGRSTKSWIDFDFFGNQLSAHISETIPELDYCGVVDDVKVPIPHYGAIVTMKIFEELKQKLISSKITFLVEPQIRYKGEYSEQATMFFLDYSGNPIEIKAFKNEDGIFN